MLKRIKALLNKKKCDHDYQWYTKRETFVSISGETRYQICTKCGHENGSIHLKYEGAGFK